MPIASYRIDFHALPNATREAMPRRAKDFERGSRISGRGTGIASTGLLASDSSPPKLPPGLLLVGVGDVRRLGIVDSESVLFSEAQDQLCDLTGLWPHA